MLVDQLDIEHLCLDAIFFYFQGYNSSSCVIDGLEEFWRYRVYVYGETEAGPSDNKYSLENITTLEAGKSNCILGTVILKYLRKTKNYAIISESE